MPESSDIEETRPKRIAPSNGAVYSRGPGDLPPGESPNGQMPSTSNESGEEEKDNLTDAQKYSNWLVSKAQEIYSTSTDYLEANLANTWERSIAHFRSEHSPDSAYRTSNWKRSKTFRPKTRANVKAQEAALAAAAFSTQDFMNVQARDQTNERQCISAEISKSLLQYRLEAAQRNWFLTVVGAYQDTKVYGVCISHQYWSYKQDTEIVPAFNEFNEPIFEEDEATGERMAMGEEKTIVREDRMACDLIAPENFRFDPMCDWRDPAGTSPYLIYMMPIYAGDALEMMEKLDPKTGQPAWNKYSLAQILSTRRQTFDRTRQAREGNHRTDPADQQNTGNTYSMLWAHLNIIKVDGDDIAYWTMGTDLLLTEPVKLTEMYPHLKEGERPFVVGFSTVEAHRNYPAGDVEQSAPLQVEINAIANQRLDNVKLVLNKRHFVRRGSQVDLDALIRNTPGGGVMMNDPEKDVKIVTTPDVTGSSYQEQDRLAVEFDELVGGFSQSSVQSNRALNETVGGMQQVASSAGAVQDYAITIFFQTWLGPVLRQLHRLVSMYETDDVLLALAARQSDLWTKYGVDKVTDDLLQQDLLVSISVGLGNTDPMRRVERLAFGVKNTFELPGMAARLKADNVANEIFGAMGYKDASRFYKSEEELAKDQEGKQPEIPPEIQVKMRELDIREKDNAARNDRELLKLQSEVELGYARLALDKELKLEEVYTRLGTEQAKLKTNRDITALREANRISEMNMKRSMGSGSKS